MKIRNDMIFYSSIWALVGTTAGINSSTPILSGLLGALLFGTNSLIYFLVINRKN